MYYLEFFVVERAQIRTKHFPFPAQEYVDGHKVIALPPPDVGKIEIQAFELGILQGPKIIYGSDGIIGILHYADVFVAGVNDQRDKGVLLA